MASGDSVMVIEGLKKSFGGVSAVNSFHCEVRKDKVHSLIGPNGAGKTTVFNLISGLIKPDAGSICLGGRNLAGKPANVISQMGIGRTFQNLKIFKDLTVEENVLVPLHAHQDKGIASLLGTPTHGKRFRDLALPALALVGLRGKESAMAKNLPYGDQKRLEIARALAWKPSLILLDEPTAGMNPSEAVQMIDGIDAIRRSGVTVMLVEHNMRVVMDISDWITVIDFGEVIAEGVPDQVRNDERVIKAYLGAQR